MDPTQTAFVEMQQQIRQLHLAIQERDQALADLRAASDRAQKFQPANWARPQLPKFRNDGDSYTTWLTTVKVQVDDLPADQKFQALTRALEGAALDAYAALLQLGPQQPRNDTEVYKVFNDLFAKTELPAERELRFRAIKYTGDMGRYTKAFDKALIVGVEPVAEQDRMRYFLAGLATNKVIFTHVANANCATMAELRRTAERFADLGGAMGGSVTNTASPMDVNAATKDEGCWNCGRPGHRKFECRQPGGGAHAGTNTKKKDKTKQHGKKFANSKGRGRGSKAFSAEGDPEADDSGSEGEVKDSFYSSSSIPVPQSVNHAGAQNKPEQPDEFCCLVKLQGKRMIYEGWIKTKNGSMRKVRVLIDSGATRNMVSIRISKLLNLQRLNDEKKTIFRFANGTFYSSDERARGTLINRGPVRHAAGPAGV